MKNLFQIIINSNLACLKCFDSKLMICSIHASMNLQFLLRIPNFRTNQFAFALFFCKNRRGLLLQIGPKIHDSEVMANKTLEQILHTLNHFKFQKLLHMQLHLTTYSSK